MSDTNDYAGDFRTLDPPTRQRIYPQRWASKTTGCQSCQGFGWEMYRNHLTGKEWCETCATCRPDRFKEYAAAQGADRKRKSTD